MKKSCALALVLAMIFSIAACQSSSVGVIGGADEPTSIIVSDKNDVYKSYESALGFKMTYDSSEFEHKFEENIERFIYKEKLDAPIYTAVQLFNDMDAQMLSQGLALQSGTDDVMLYSTHLGADGIETKSVYYTKTAGEIEQIFSYHIVDTDKGALLVETVGYVGQTKKADSKLEELLASFSIK